MRSSHAAHAAGNFIKLAVLLVFIFPFLWMVSTSLQTYPETMRYPPTLIPRHFQLINFAIAMKAGPFAVYARNSVVIALSIILLQTLVMVPAAYAFARYRFPGRDLLFGVVLLCLMIPGQITFIPIYLLMGDWGLMKTLLPQILPFMTNAFGIFLLRQYFMQIPQEMIEAARLDGAGETAIITRVMVPMSLPALATVGLLSFIAHWNDYFWPLVITNSTDIRTLPIGIQMLQATEGVTQWHIVMAGNVVLVIPIIVAYLLFSRQILKAFVGSGIK